MTYPADHMLKMTPAVTGTIVSRPRHTDAIGKALSYSFGPVHVTPPDLLLALEKLDGV